ncbi:Sodium/calcium exchanger NCL [Linum perenne]
MAKSLIIIFLFSLLTWPAQTRFISTPKDEPILVSDGGVDSVHRQQSSFIKMVSSYGGGCHETYGFLPCTETVPGNVFLIVVYGYMMFLAAKLLSCGSEILLHMLGPGIVGGLFLPVLGSLPDAAIILASGVSGSKEAAQRQISVGMGMMAGSNVMMLTLLWGSCLVIGKLDIGISTDIWTCYGARIMLISLLPFVIVQLPQAFQTREGNTNTAVLVSLIVAIVLLISYSLYQVFQPWIQKRKIAYSKHKQLISGVLKQLKAKTLGRLFMDNGQPNVDAIQKLFSVMDEDTDGYLTAKELRALVIGIQLEEGDMDIDNAVYHVLKEFDTSDDSLIDKEEFVQGVSRWLEKAKNSALYGHRSLTNKLLLDFEEIYGSVTMSNILSLSVFLGLVYYRDLTWNFSAEVLIILVVCITMGLIASFRTNYPLWMCFVAFGLYPVSLFLAYILDYVVGWT